VAAAAFPAMDAHDKGVDINQHGQILVVLTDCEEFD
jgi:hypothetical protein